MSRITTETSFIPGPAGPLEALINAVENGGTTEVAVVCHPHPLHGGTMTNKVAHMLAKSFNVVGITAIRFNFRGVGRSAGTYADGIGETDDALAVIEWARQRWPDAAVSLAGFSFGGAVAIRAASLSDPARLITAAPAVDRVHVPLAQLPRCPWLVIQGDEDEIVAADVVQSWIQKLPIVPELALLRGVGHFFHGRLNELQDTVTAWLARHPVAVAEQDRHL
ncbi:MAG: alpha/beta hydrolase [Gammaproteobacteria bacterium]|nr:alpha/beta hydrolase [Gammaproteobacteria bacterium]